MAVRTERHGLLVVGAGVAGLSAALAAAEAGTPVTVVVDTELGGGSSPWAQGGLAAALAPDDSTAAHAEDTLAVSAGLGAREVVEVLTDDAPGAVTWLRHIGADFDTDAAGNLLLGREAGHRARRIVHARGDATGAEIMRALVDAVRRTPTIALRERTVAVDLVRDGGRVVGVYAFDGHGEPVVHLAGAVLLATGGYGWLFARTTNPPQVAGASIAMAARAGAAVADVEMVQFHPTALAAEGCDPLPLLTEALRGEGAILINRLGERYMPDEHADAELAPRDVVARANYRQLQAGNVPALDARTAVGATFPDRFPTVFALATANGLDPRVEPLPVSPAAHYCMGGVATDVGGRSSLPGLWVIGEAASTGVHGANRLASNSMLEGVVMGRRVAAGIGAVPRAAVPRRATVPADAAAATTATADVAATQAIRQVLWNRAGVVRDEAGLSAGLAELDTIELDLGSDLRARNAAVVARLVLEAALARRESRGAHFRSDHPLTDPAQATRTILSPAAVPTVALLLQADATAVAA